MRVIITGTKRGVSVNDVQAALMDCTDVGDFSRIINVGMCALNGREVIVSLKRNPEFFESVFKTRVASVQEELDTARWEVGR